MMIRKLMKGMLAGLLALTMLPMEAVSVMAEETEEPVQETEEYTKVRYNGRTAYMLNPTPEMMKGGLSGVSLLADTNEDIIWDFFKSEGFSDAGTAGIMGNLLAESGFEPTNLENGANINSGLSDAEFTKQVNNGTITREEFISSEEIGIYKYTDSTGTYYTYGYGLAQWTFYTRKAALYDFWKEYGCSSIGNLDMQLNFMMKEMSAYLKNEMTNADDVTEATVTFHNIYEGSADNAERIQGRVNNALNIYERYASGGTVTPSCACSEKYSGTYTTMDVPSTLNIRAGHGTGYSIIGSIPAGATFKITKAEVAGGEDGWGHVEYNGIRGYINMGYAKKIEEVSSAQFSDIVKGKYYYDAVLWAAENGITTGKNGKFMPDDNCTRGHVVTFLWRAAGSPEPKTTKNPFSDLDTSKYYYKAVLWAAENGITTGKDGRFMPDATCTRGEAVTFLWRSVGKPAPSSANNPFSDLVTSKFYYEPVLWANETGVTTGKNGKFMPNDTCTRGHVVTFLYRYYVG